MDRVVGGYMGVSRRKERVDYCEYGLDREFAGNNHETYPIVENFPGNRLIT